MARRDQNAAVKREPAVVSQAPRKGGPCSAWARCLDVPGVCSLDPRLQLTRVNALSSALIPSRPPPGSDFWRSDISPKKPRPDERAQCLGGMPWSCRATAFKPNADACSDCSGKVNDPPGIPRQPQAILWGNSMTKQTDKRAVRERKSCGAKTPACRGRPQSRPGHRPHPHHRPARRIRRLRPATSHPLRRSYRRR